MARCCDRCGRPAVDVVGSRQCSLLDVPADPRATDAARAELRAGRVLCSACQRTEDLPGMREADAALTAQAVGLTFDLDDVTIRTTLEAFPVADEAPHDSRHGWDRIDGVSIALPAKPARKPRVKRNKNWRGDMNADAWERAKAGR